MDDSDDDDDKNCLRSKSWNMMANVRRTSYRESTHRALLKTTDNPIGVTNKNRDKIREIVKNKNDLMVAASLRDLAPRERP